MFCLLEKTWLSYILSFIMYAFTSQINKDAQDFMVEEYKHLRQRDSTGTAKSAWRITVRQLESMIRLSEGMARLHCQDEVNYKILILSSILIKP